MRVRGFNHLSVGSTNMEESVRFYERLFGMERLPTYNFGFKTQYMRCGDLQLHIFELDDRVPVYQHFAIDVDDFHAVYDEARALDVLDNETFRNSVNELPDGSVQMYLRDPGGNLVEVDWPNVTSLDRARIPHLKKLADFAEQRGEALEASLYYDRPQMRGRAKAGSAG
jgi:catechol 2,3-dioxygenase-like lactoylglutathione lyase family enzyme